jgi:hypothetical protein
MPYHLSLSVSTFTHIHQTRAHQCFISRISSITPCSHTYMATETIFLVTKHFDGLNATKSLSSELNRKSQNQTLVNLRCILEIKTHVLPFAPVLPFRSPKILTPRS